MNDPHDNAETDRDALERWGTGRTESVQPGWGTSGADLLTGVAAEKYDPETGVLPWDGGGIKDGRIVSIEGLDRMGDHLAAYERGILQSRALHAAAVKRMEERLERSLAPLCAEVVRIRAMVEAFALEQGRKGICIGRLKSRTLPSGLRLAWREREKGEYRWDQSKTPAENKAALLAWAKAQHTTMTLVERGPEQPVLATIKDFLTKFGDATPPGLEFVPPGETLTISVDARGEEP